MPNTLLTPKEMGQRVLDTVREVCKGDEELMRQVLDLSVDDFMNMDMNSKRIAQLPKPVQLAIGDLVKIDGFVGSFAVHWHEGRLSLVPVSRD